MPFNTSLTQTLATFPDGLEVVGSTQRGSPVQATYDYTHQNIDADFQSAMAPQ